MARHARSLCNARRRGYCSTKTEENDGTDYCKESFFLASMAKLDAASEQIRRWAQQNDEEGGHWPHQSLALFTQLKGHTWNLPKQYGGVRSPPKLTESVQLK